jgi:hypothetical protein
VKGLLQISAQSADELVLVDELELDAVELDVSLLELGESELDDESPPELDDDSEDDDDRLSVL